MNQQIKFRAKCLDDGKWVYGYYVQDDIYPTSYIYNFVKGIIEICVAKYSSVSKETIGQFTGLQDENGIDVYQGDKIFVLWNDIDGCDYEDKCVVEWVQEFYAFAFKSLYKEDTIYLMSEFDFDCDHVKVIGNIHDKEAK